MSERARSAQKFRRQLGRRLEELLADLPNEVAAERIEQLRAHGHKWEADKFAQLREEEIRRRRETEVAGGNVCDTV